MFENFLEKSPENGPLAEKNDKTERAKGLGRKTVLVVVVIEF